MSHTGIIELIALSLKANLYEVHIEHPLPNGRRADIFAWTVQNTLIVEVKTIYRKSLIAEAYGKYHEWCDYLVYACPREPTEIPTGISPLLWSDERLDKVGTWLIDARGILVTREAKRLR